VTVAPVTGDAGAKAMYGSPNKWGLKHQIPADFKTKSIRSLSLTNEALGVSEAQLPNLEVWSNRGMRSRPQI